ncbi:hypothetical protein NT6N_07990 [Oceaniferula spumae]|uniref:3-keto-disaccharide hydrolase domain-containing protein n=1 Tax=Oceaniferula spumae TaxID=2979115 RepID=A0AAT9FIF0_9BACT
MPPHPHRTSAGHLLHGLLMGTLCLSPCSATAAEEVKKPPLASALLSNGNKLSGNRISVENGHLTVESDQLQKPAKLKLDQVLSLQFVHPPLERPEGLEALLNFQPGFRMRTADSLAGELLSINKDSVVFKTNDTGTKTIKRTFISSIETLQTGENYYRGPNSALEWGINADNTSWMFTRNHLNSLSNGGIGRDIKLAEKSHVSFQARWETSMRFRLHLYSSDHNDDSPDANYDLNFNRSYVYLRTRGKIDANGGSIASGGRWTQLNLPREITKAKFDIYTDRKTGKIILYIDNLKTAELDSQSPDPRNLGTGIRFIAEERYPIKISDITIRPWDGVSIPTQPAPGAAPKQQHPFLFSTDGKIHAFTALKKENKDYVITSPDKTTNRFQAVDVIKMVLPPTEAEQPKKFINDIRVQFQHGGQMTLQLNNISDGKLHGHSKLLGDLTYDLRAFSLIDFNIYDHKYDKLRENKQ